MPWTWTFALTEKHAPTNAVSKVWGVLQNETRVFLLVGATAGTDDSGGKNSRDPQMRRVGWGLVLATAHGCRPFGAAYGSLAGLRQSVPRAELNAFLELAKRTDDDVTCVVDCDYVINGFRRGPEAMHRSHADRWS